LSSIFISKPIRGAGWFWRWTEPRIGLMVVYIWWAATALDCYLACQVCSFCFFFSVFLFSFSIFCLVNFNSNLDSVLLAGFLIC
jgi:hypothetical protein